MCPSTHLQMEAPGCRKSRIGTAPTPPLCFPFSSSGDDGGGGSPEVITGATEPLLDPPLLACKTQRVPAATRGRPKPFQSTETKNWHTPRSRQGPGSSNAGSDLATDLRLRQD